MADAVVEKVVAAIKEVEMHGYGRVTIYLEAGRVMRIETSVSEKVNENPSGGLTNRERPH